MYTNIERVDKIKKWEQRPTQVDGLTRDEMILYNSQRQLQIENGKANFMLANERHAQNMMTKQNEKLIDKHMLQGNFTAYQQSIMHQNEIKKARQKNMADILHQQREIKNMRET